MQLYRPVNPDRSDGLYIGGARGARDEGHGGREAIFGCEQREKVAERGDNFVGGDDGDVDGRKDGGKAALEAPRPSTPGNQCLR